MKLRYHSFLDPFAKPAFNWLFQASTLENPSYKVLVRLSQRSGYMLFVPFAVKSWAKASPSQV